MLIDTIFIYQSTHQTMNSTIVQSILSLFNADATQSMANQVGETPDKVKGAIQSIIPLIMKGFTSKAAEGPEAVQGLLGTATSATSSSWFTNVSNWFTGSNEMMDKGKDILHDIFGGQNVQRIADGVAKQNNIQPEAAHSLMQMAAPLALAELGRHIDTNNLDVSGLASWFTKEKMNLEAAVPAAVTAAVGTGAAAAASTVSNAASTATNAASNITNSVTKAASNAAASVPDYNDDGKTGGNKWLIPLLLLLVAAGLIWWFSKGCNGGKTDVVVADTAAKKAEAPAMTLPSFKWNADSTISYTYGDTISLKLPNGTDLRVPGNGAEAMLVNKIKEAMDKGLDTSAEGKKNGWINLYDVQFAKMLDYREGASAQINNVQAILKAYPGVHIKVGGYTDNTGNADANKKLSQQRAEKVATDLGAGGIAGQLDKAEGYGDQFPVGDNATTAGRAQNRRVSCRITSVTK